MSEKRDSIIRAREYARTLYMTQPTLTQKEIAARVGITEQTLSRWVRTEGWEELRKASQFTKENEIKRMYAQLAELNAMIESRDKGCRFPSSKEADIQRKIAANIHQLEFRAGLTDIIQVTEEVVGYFRAVDYEKARVLMEAFDQFVQHKLTEANNG